MTKSPTEVERLTKEVERLTKEVERLTKERDEAKLAARQNHQHGTAFLNRAIAAEAEVERLRKELSK
jgi:hypothetical protein